MLFTLSIQKLTLCLEVIRFLCSYSAMKIYSGNLGAPARVGRPVILPQASTPSSVLHFLNKGLLAAKAFFEGLLSVPSCEYRNFSSVEWSRLISAVTVMSTLSFAVPAVPEWDHATARNIAKFGMYVECLCFRFQELSVVGKEPSGRKLAPDVFCMFNSVLQVLKQTYEEKVNSIEPILMSPLNLRCPVLSGTVADTEYWDLIQNYDFYTIPHHDEVRMGVIPDLNTSLFDEWG